MARIKGTGMMPTVRSVRANPAARALVAPHLRHYLAEGERISVADWYPESDHIELVRALVRAAGDPPGIWPTIGMASAQKDLGGVYRVLLREGDPAATALKAPVIWSSYHDTGRMVVTLDGRCRARFVLSDYGHPTREMCLIFDGHARGVIELAGARDVEVAHAACVLDGATSCVWEAKWKDPD